MLARSQLMHKRSSLFIGCLVIALLVNESFGQDIIFTDENGAAVHRRNHATTEESVTTASRSTAKAPMPTEECGQNMVLDDDNGTRPEICECLAGYVYHLESDQCYSTYKQGPCEHGYYFVLQANETVAKCIPNPCTNDNEVPYEGSCYPLLSSSGPCPEDLSLVISETTYEPVCEAIRAVSYHIIMVPPKGCAPGTRRAGRNLCRTILNPKINND
ncbi:uncharacterized protein [Venturia canescens]|uniref:uncharacterized protein n=1 Tax=Venturia canescens TaxID=32260 RepID=UPI001C9C7F2D|nr:uncharacterized protein LOC122409771 [Venturia canescens]